jgi:hypothetical protein
MSGIAIEGEAESPLLLPLFFWLSFRSEATESASFFAFSRSCRYCCP